MLNSSGCYMAALAIIDNLFLIVHSILSASRWFTTIDLLNHIVVCQVWASVELVSCYWLG